MNIATLIFLTCALVSGAGVLLGFLPATSLIPPLLLGVTMILALLNIVRQSDAAA